jgi:hypothetical protein
VDQPDPVSGDEEYVGMARARNDGRASMLDHEPDPVPGLLGEVDHAMNTSFNDAEAKVRTAAWARSQAARLEHGLATQSAPDFGGQHYAGYTARELHEMVTTNIDPGGLGEAGAAYNGVGNTYARLAQDLGSAASASESGWVGTAGDSVRAFLAGMAKWADTTAQGAQLAGNQLGMQADAAQTAMHSMPTPVDPPSAADVRQAMLRTPLNPAAGAAQLDQQFQAAQQTHAEAVRVVQTYDANLAAVGNTMPAFDPPQAFNPNAGNGTNGTVGGAGVPGMGTHSARGPRPQVGGADQVGPAPVLAGSASRPSPPSQPSPPTQLGPSGPAAQPDGQPPTMTPQSAPMPSPVGSTVSPPAAGASPLAGGMNLPGGQDGGANLFGSPGAPGGRAIGAPEGPGARGGVAAGVNEVVTRPASAGGSTPGLIGGRGGRGEADEEHKRPSYLENPDPDETFGTDQIVAPPVIGA